MGPLRLVTQVRPAGTVHLEALPFRDGQTVEVVVQALAGDSDDFSNLGESGLEFWENAIDDETWNDVLPPT